MQSGRPTGSLTIHMNDTPVTGMLYSADALDGFNGNFRVPFLPVNSLYTPWVQQENFRLTKIIPLPREDMRLSLNFEAFNIANNWSPTGSDDAGVHRGQRRSDLHADGIRRWNVRWRIPGWHAGAPPAGQRPLYFLAGCSIAYRAATTLTGGAGFSLLPRLQPRPPK